MRILALETSGISGSVALFNGSDGFNLPLASGQRSAQSLAPAIQTALRQMGWQPADIELVAVTSGPGSFTGLRVGVTTAKTFAWAVGAAVLGLNTLEVLAHQVPAEIDRVTTLLNAQRGAWYVADFSRAADGSMQTAHATRIVSQGDLLAQLTPGQVLSGPDLAPLERHLPGHVQLIDLQHRAPTAASVAQLAAQKYAAGERGDVWQLVPEYYRASAAEEKLGQQP